MSLPQPALHRLKALGEAAAAGNAPKGVDGIPGSRPLLVNMLLDEGAPGKDDAEPSVAVLGDLIREITFTHVIARIDLIVLKWGNDGGDYTRSARPLIAGHPLEGMMDVYAVYKQDAWAKPLAAVKVRDPVLNEFAIYRLRERALHLVGSPKSPALRLSDFADDLAWDLERVCVRQVNLKDPRMGDTIARLKEVSPHAPYAAVATVLSDWPAAEPQIPAWEKQFGNHPALPAVLGWKYLHLKRYEEAEKWARRHAKTVPDFTAFVTLAEAQRLRGDDGGGWRRWTSCWQRSRTWASSTPTWRCTSPSTLSSRARRSRR
jgi:hypothetical protein